MRTEDRVIPDLLCGRDEHLVRDTEAPELRGRQGAAATHRAASVAYAVTGLPSLAGPAACVATGRSRRGSKGSRSTRWPAGDRPGADAMIANTGTARSLEVCPETT
jgi:hypothetical protein